MSGAKLLPALALASALPCAVIAQQQGAQQGWTRFQDPQENAFSVEVPAGWAVVGGMVRPFPNDTRIVMELRSPDGTIEVGYGDKDLPSFTLPVPMYTQMGLREGAVMNPGNVMAPYRSGSAFAVEYGRTVFARACGQPVQVVRQDSDDSAGQKFAQGIAVPNATATFGQAVFVCDGPQHRFAAVAAAMTLLMPFQGIPGGMWAVPIVTRMAVTDPARAQQATDVLSHLTTTLQMSPQWQAAQLQAQQQAITARQQAMAAQTQPSQQPTGPTSASIQQDLDDYRRGVINHVHQNRMVANDRITRDTVDTINGTQRLVNPGTGTQYAVPYGYNSYSLAPNGAVVGSMGGGPAFSTPLNRTNN